MAQHAHAGRNMAPLAAVLGAIALLAVTLSGAQQGGAGSAAAVADTPADPSKGDAASGQSGKRSYKTETLRGHIVFVEDALARDFGVTTEPDAAKKSVVLETSQGKLWPIVPDTRGQAFVVDERLRGIDLELLVRRYDDAPLLQVIRVYRPKDGGLVEVDYWCDICSIPMFILKSCECCQGPTRLRERPVVDGVTGPEAP